MGGWVGEKEAVGTSYWKLGVAWVGWVKEEEAVGMRC